MARLCSHCDKPLSDEAQTCAFCGSAVANAQGSEETTSADDAGQTIQMPEIEASLDDGATRAMPEPEEIDEKGTARLISDDEGTTRAIPARETISDDGSTTTIPEVEPDAEGGATTAIPDSDRAEPPARAARPTLVDLPTGQVLNHRYRLTQTLGRGGFGAAYLAEDQTLKRLCVVKQMLLPSIISPKQLALYRSNFEREANLLAQLNHPGHPHIPEIYDYFSDETGNYLVMKYIEGHSLKHMIEQSEEPLPWRQVIRYAVDLCSALHYMHTHGEEPVIHRDIKPANLVLSIDDRIWLLDFGLAKAQPVESANEAGVTKASGSLGYSPLEQWLGEATPASDIYSLGATLHHLLTGLDPGSPFGSQFNIQKLQQLHGQFIPIRKVNRELPESLEEIIASATGADPEQRPSALQLQQQFEVLVTGAKDAPLFTFKSGEVAKSKGTLVDLCDRYRREAITYLYGGDFKRWFKLTNRNDLAEAADRGVRLGKTQRDGLERFLKLVLPNLFFRRLGRAALHVTRGSIQFILTGIVIILALIVLASFVARLLIWQVIGNSAWDFQALDFDQPNSYTELELNQLARDYTDVVLDNILVDLHPPNHVDVAATWGGIFLIELPFIVEQGDNKPHFQLTGINDLQLWQITDLVNANISRGINDGIERAFREAPVNIGELEIEENQVTFFVERREGVPSPTPTATPPDSEPVTPTAPDRTTLLAVTNALDRDIILKIDDELWQIASNDKEIIKLAPGTYRYQVQTVDGAFGDEGVRDWTLDAYELRIDLNQVANLEGEE